MDILKGKIPNTIYERLLAAGFKSPKEILLLEKEKLHSITKLKNNEINRLNETISCVLMEGKLQTAFQIPKWHLLKTGCEEIDLILRGGIPVNGIVEIYGCSGVGKTQLCLQLSLMVQMPKELGGFEKCAVYICSEDAFPSKRLHQLSKTFLFRYKNYEGILDFESNIYVEHVTDFEQFDQCLCVRLPVLMSMKCIGLIVVDSIAGVFRSDNIDTDYVTRSQQLIRVANKLNVLSQKYDAAVVVLNQVADNTVTNTSEPCLGLAWSNLISCRVKIARNFDGALTRKFEIVFAPDLPCDYCNFVIKDVGIIGI